MLACTLNATSTPKPAPLSSTLATSEMWPSFSAQSDAQNLRIYTALLKASDFVDLDTGDSLTVTVGANSTLLTKESTADGRIHYTATLPAQAAAADVVIAFHRPIGKQAALLSKTKIAAPFEITSTTPANFRLGDRLPLVISPAPVIDATASDQMTIAFSGECLPSDSPFPITFDTEGNASFDTSVVKLKQGAAAGCAVGVEVRHETRGGSDVAFNGAPSHPVEGLQARGFQTIIVK